MQTAIVKRALEPPFCGDDAGVWTFNDMTTLCIIDGLGHGKFAELAAKEAMMYVADHLGQSLPDLFAGCNLALRHTRGVAMGIVVINEETNVINYAGVGNTRALVIRENNSCFSSNYGIVGAGYKNLAVQNVSLKKGDLIILYTDGIEEMIDLSGYEKVDIQKLAEGVVEDYHIKRDDAAVLIYKMGSTHEAPIDQR